jgi:hypothetical protein
MTLIHEITIYAPIASIIILWAFLQWHGKLPSAESIQSLATVMATKGGNILILTGMGFVFFFAGLRLIYYCLSLSIDGKVSTDNAVMMLAITFVTGTAFGGTQGALLKTMTGENVKSNDTVSSTVTVTNPTLPAIPTPEVKP